MNLSDRPPSAHWATLKFKGVKFAEVWFKPEGDPLGITFRIPRESFQIAGIDQQLTLANLLRAVALSHEAVDSWRHADATQVGQNGSTQGLENPLPPPSQQDAYLEIHVRMQSATEAAAPTPALTPPLPETSEASADRDPAPAAAAPGEGADTAVDIPEVKWQELAAMWRALVSVEAAIDAMRMSMDSLLLELESSWKKSLSPEEKLHAPRADVAQWTRAKNRVHHALPKVKDYIHRAVWAMGAPERKKLAAVYDEHIEPRVPFAQIDQVEKELESLQKARQVLFTLGKTVYQEGKSIAADVQNSLRALQNNAAANAKSKMAAAKGGKFFKEVRKFTK